MKRPAFQFYPADWRKDAELQSCSIGARGLWHELMCVMHECDPYGHLVVNGAAMADAQAARLVGVDLRDYKKLMRELDAAGVPGRTADAVIFSRRMVRDERLRETRAACGKLGGNPVLLGREVNQDTTTKDKVEPTPSSSSSSSSSSKPGSERTPDIPGTANGSHPAVENIAGQGKGDGKGMNWDDPGYVAETGKSLAILRHQGEDDASYRDRVISGAQRLRVIAEAETARRAGA